MMKIYKNNNNHFNKNNNNNINKYSLNKKIRRFLWIF